MTLPYLPALLDISLLEMVTKASLTSQVVLGLLVVISLLSWTIIFAKWQSFGKARSANNNFLRGFRKAQDLDAVAMASEQFRFAPLVGVFDFGYQEVSRQVKTRGRVVNKISLERTLQLGISEELTPPAPQYELAGNRRIRLALHRAVRHRARASSTPSRDWDRRAAPACAPSRPASPKRSSPRPWASPRPSRPPSLTTTSDTSSRTWAPAWTTSPSSFST